MIPVILFVYSRPDHLKRTLDCLKENNVPKLYIFSDGAQTSNKESAVKEVRKIIHEIDWCEAVITERPGNLGLGSSIMAGVTEVFRKEDIAIVFEDDLICVPGTYQYLCAALEQYRDDPRVMSVTGWTHRTITPNDVTNQPYFDGRAECFVWGTWSSAWKGMTDHTAADLMERCDNLGIDIYRYGADLVGMAKAESRKNIWAVRFLYWHMVNGGLCLRPPWSMVDHIGNDNESTNVKSEMWTKNDQLKPCPQIPDHWPEPVENPGCFELHQTMCGRRPGYNALITSGIGIVKTLWVEYHGLTGDYHSWDDAVRASTGYDSDIIIQKTKTSLLKVKKGYAAYERDTVLFDTVEYCYPVLAGLMWIAAQHRGVLNVLDFGGSLGTTYYQNRVFLRGLSDVRWNIIEQPRHVKAGKESFEDDVLKFYPTIESCLNETKPNVILLSSVLQYLEKPYDVLNSLLDLPIDYLIIDKTPFRKKGSDHLCIQHVPPDIYPASYPCWILSREKFLQQTKDKRFEVVTEFVNPDRPRGPVDFHYCGMILALGER